MRLTSLCPGGISITRSLGEWKDHRDCHIKPDLLLIYRKPDARSLELVRLGSHSELGFKTLALYSPGSARLLQLHPVVAPQVSHFRQVPLRTRVKFAHSGQASPT